MVRRLLQILVLLLCFIGIFLTFTVTIVDREPYWQMEFYTEMSQRLDSLKKSATPGLRDTLKIGWSKVNITPSKPQPLAGYGKREPKVMTGVEDSCFVGAVVFKSGEKKVTLITADLLIIHPEISRKVWSILSPGWDPHDIYFTASHTHSGLGGWAPGLIGKLFAGPFDQKIADGLARKIANAVLKAEENVAPGAISFIEFALDDLVRNRLVNEKGIVDPWLKVLRVKSGSKKGFISFYGAHATCLGPENKRLSGDYPSVLNRLLEKDSAVQFAAFGAGAVGSMGHGARFETDQAEVRYMANELKEQIDLFDMLETNEQYSIPVTSYQLEVPLRAPYFKVTKNLSIRPYLFNALVGEYQAHVRVMQLGNLLFIGLPCDFSGELAVHLYEKAKAKGINLIISSFNGEYIGYIVKDEWYDLPKYEARTMSWYGPDVGAYFSEIITRIVDATPNYQANTIGR